MMKKIGLTLGGGGARGLCHIAFLKCFDEMQLRPSIISGTSIGAIAGAFYAAGMSGVQIEYIIDKVGFTEITKMVDFALLKNTAFLKGKGVVDFLYRHIPAREFKDLHIPLKIVATDFWNRKEVVFESGELIPALRASMSLPGVFEPVKINNRILVDGGAVNPLPYDLIRDESDLLIAIDVSGAKIPTNQSRMPIMFENIISTFEIMQSSIIENKKKCYQPDITIKPDLHNIQLLEFYKYKSIVKSVESDVAGLKTQLSKLIKKKLFHF